MRTFADSSPDSGVLIDAILHAVTDPVVRIDADGQILSWNSSATRELGIEDVDHRSFRLFLADASRARFSALCDRLVSSTGRAESDELIVFTKTSKPALRRISVILIGQSPRPGFLCVLGAPLRGAHAKDLEEQLVHATKLAGIGSLAAGVIHEINNPLAILKGYLLSLKRELSGRDGIEGCQRLLDKQERAIDRIATIVSSFKRYARLNSDGSDASPQSAEVFALHEVVRESLMLMDSIHAKEGVRIETRFSAGTLSIRGSQGRLQQVLMNLLSNAYDALDGRPGACITVVTEGAAGCAQITVEDNGCGISPLQLQRVFEPFFTTKPAGKGTGLGLSITRSLVTEMGGTVEAKSEAGKGAAFVLRFPLVEEETSVLAGEPAQPCSAEKLAGKALVVDDEQDIREILRSWLEGFGLEVAEAADGCSALDMLERGGFDYVFTDVKMPKMAGDVLIREARRRGFDQVRFIVVTGGLLTDYTKDQLELFKAFASGYIKKPFNSGDLMAAIQGARTFVWPVSSSK